MTSDAFWQELNEACDAIEPRSALVTPVSERQFEIQTTEDDRIVVRFRDSDEERPLWREQFAVLADRIEDEPVTVTTLAPGVEPYASVITLAPGYVVEDDELTHEPADATAGESPYLVPPEEARTQPQRVHDDALLLADALDRVDATRPTALDTDVLTDLYVLSSDVQRGADRLRRSFREPLLDRLGPDQQLHGRFGTVRRTTRQRRRPKDDETVLGALDERGIPHEWVLGVDPDKLDVVLAVTELTEDEVYDVHEQVYAQKTGTDEQEKYSRLQGLADRLEAVEGARGEELREDLDALETRIEEALAG